MNLIISLCYSERKPAKDKPTRMKTPIKNKIRDCGYLGCVNEITEESIVRRAIVGNKHYGFCSEYCYEEWLSMPILN